LPAAWGGATTSLRTRTLLAWLAGSCSVATPAALELTSLSKSGGHSGGKEKQGNGGEAKEESQASTLGSAGVAQKVGNGGGALCAWLARRGRVSPLETIPRTGGG